MTEKEKLWICKNCSTEFIPKLPNLSCPKCMSNNTLPKVMKKVEEAEQRALVRAREKEEEARKKELEALEKTTTLSKLLRQHLQYIGVKATVMERFLSSNPENTQESGPLTIAGVDIEGRNIDHVTIIRWLAFSKGSHRDYAYIYRYTVDVDIFDKYGVEYDLQADTKPFREKGPFFGFLGKVAGYNWVRVKGVLKKGIKSEEGLLVSRLNADSDLKNKLSSLGLFKDIMVQIIDIDHRAGINHGGRRENYPSLEIFEAFDRIAGHIRAVTGNARS